MAKTPKSEARTDARAEAVKHLQKQMGHVFVEEETATAPVQGISTGCIAADHVTGIGGFPRGRMTEVYGFEQSGKSTLCQTACAKAQAQGLYPVYIDLERGLDAVFAQHIGFDVKAAAKGEKGLYIRPDSFEETLQTIESMAEAGVDLICVDSVAAMTPQAILEGEITDIGAIGLQARLFSVALPRIVKVIDKSKTALVFVNQLRSDIQLGWQPLGTARMKNDKTTGGKALKFYASVRLELEQLKKDAKIVERPSMTGAKYPDKIAVASRHSVLAYKNKVAAPYLKMEFFIRYDAGTNVWGIDNRQTILDVAQAQGKIETKGGGYLYYKGAGAEANVKGEDALYSWFREHPEEIQHLRKELGL